VTAFSFIDPVDEENTLNDAQGNVDAQRKLEEVSNQDVASRVGEIYKDYPYIPASTILALAKGGASKEAVQLTGQMAANQLTKEPKKKRSWLERNVYGKVKAVSRWGAAGLQLIPDLAQNAASQIFSENQPDGWSGWFKSTALGTMMANSDVAGEGFFMGGEAAVKQAERAREFRGTVMGPGGRESAWTIGRGAAELVFTPGSKPYAILSGFLDAAVNLGGDPTNYYGATVGKALKEARRIPGLSGDALTAARSLARGEAGLDAAESVAFTSSKFGQWVQKNNGAKRLIDNVVEVSSKADASIETKTFQILELFDYRIDPDTATRFAQSSTTDQVYGLLGEAAARLDNITDDILLPSQVKDLTGAKWSYSIKERTPLRRFSNHRWFQQMPKGSVVINGTGLERAESIKTYANYLRGIGVENVDNHPVMQLAVQAYRQSDPAKAKNLLDDAFTGVVREVLQSAGIKNETDIATIIERGKKELAEARAYLVNAAGEADDGGFIKALLDPDNGFLSQADIDLYGVELSTVNNPQLIGPGALSEMLDNVQFLPDYRKIRALANSPRMSRALYSGKTADKRAAYKLFEFLQTDIWKPMQLATGGYIMRNMFDAQVRMAMTGKKGFFNHPFQYIMMSMNKKAGYNISGNKFDLAYFADEANVAKGMDRFQEALTFGVYKHLEDSTAATERMLRNGNFTIADRGLDAIAHTTGYVDNLGLMNADVILSRVAKYAGLDPDDRKRRILKWLNSADGADSKRQLVSYLQNLQVADPQTGRRIFIGIPESQLTDDNIIGAWVDRLSEFRVNTIVRGDEDLRIVTAFDRVPLYGKTADGATQAADRVRLTFDELSPHYIQYDEERIGSIVSGAAFGADESVEGVVVGIVRENGQEFALVQPVVAGKALTDDFLGSPALRNLIDMKGNQGKLAQKVKRAERGTDKATENRWNDVRKSWDKATDFFFNRIYGKASSVAEKSPVFRQFYYDDIAKNADLLSRDEATKLLDNITTSAAQLEISPEDYVGSRAVWKQLQKTAATANGSGTIQQLDEFAQALALDQTKSLLYNAVERNNLEDIMRIIVPFGSAWKEVLGTYFNAMLEDPTRLRKAQVIFNGATKFDPDANGEGFFYKDPTTGEYSFNFPFSGALTKLVTGVEAPMQAPVKRLSVGLGVIPSLGPVGQIAASQIIPDTPSFDFITKTFLPYGRTTGIEFRPNWLSKAMDAWRANESDAKSLYANTYVDTVRALAASGQYDLSDYNEQERMYSDARNKARVLTALRAVGQFLGPTSPQAEFRVPTEQGDVYATYLSKELYRMQAENYDTSVDTFINTFGEDAFIYLSSKTQSLYGGLEASEQFGDWERGNGALFNKYPDVAGFMAPGGDDFSFEVWSRQLRGGKRERLTAREVVEQAQYRIASARYRALRAKLPDTPSQEQKEWLRRWRVELNKQYPGFPVVAEFNPGEYPAKIEQMTRMVQDPDLQGNETAQALAQYLAAREKAVAQYVQGGGSAGGFSQAKAAEPLRDWLFTVGQALVSDTPEFARIWDRVLSSEVEQ
jgi:hypothetical protein